MKKIISFLNQLKPYKRLYKIFWMVLTIIILFIFQIIMLSLVYAVPHNNSGFSYWVGGLYSLLVRSRVEPASAQGFIFAATVLGYIPIIIILPILYFITANWIIKEKLSDKFIDVPAKKYIRWSNYFHFLIIGSVFIIIPGLLSLLAGGGILPNQTWRAYAAVLSTNFWERIGGISVYLYYGIGCTFISIVIFWSIFILFEVIFKKIKIWSTSLKEKRSEKQEVKTHKNNKTKDSLSETGSSSMSMVDTKNFDITDEI